MLPLEVVSTEAPSPVPVCGPAAVQVPPEQNSGDALTRYMGHLAEARNLLVGKLSAGSEKLTDGICVSWDPCSLNTPADLPPLSVTAVRAAFEDEG